MSSRVHSYLVNALTFSRVPLIFGFLICAVLAQTRGSLALALAAGALMFLAGISDLYDGKLARRWQVVSTFGKLADPLMDKVFFIVTFPTLLWLIGAQRGPAAHAALMLVFTVLYILRDQWVTFLRSVAAAYQADVGAMWLGKVRTALSFPCAGWVYAYLCLHRVFPASWSGPWLVSCYVAEIALILLTLWSLHTYTQAYLPYLKKALERN